MADDRQPLSRRTGAAPHCLFLAAASVALLALFKVPLKHLLPRTLCAGTVLFLGVTALLAGIISTDFTKYFIIFHKIFFTNDLWQLDPRTDLLINIVAGTIFHWTPPPGSASPSA